MNGDFDDPHFLQPDDDLNPFDLHTQLGHDQPGLCAELPVDHHYIGTPFEDSHHCGHQTAEYNCAVEAERGILEALTGHSFAEIDLTTEAAQHGWLTVENGTPLFDTDKLLNFYGVPTHQVTHATFHDLVSELASGHKIIVGVDSSVLHPSVSQLHGLHDVHGADHAIWVTGVDTTDPDDLRVIVNDSADPDGAGKSYSMNEFMAAWEGSEHFYTATDEAPPDLHTTSPDFDPDTGVFTEIADWVKAHAPSAGSVMAGVGMVGSVMDVAERLKRFKGESSNTASRATADVGASRERKPAAEGSAANPPEAPPAAAVRKRRETSAAPATPTTPIEPAKARAQPASPAASSPSPRASAARQSGDSDSGLRERIERAQQARQQQKEALLQEAQQPRARRSKPQQEIQAGAPAADAAPQAENLIQFRQKRFKQE